MSGVTTPGNFDPAGFRQLTATDLGPAVGIPGVGNARVAEIQAIGNNVRWRDDGTDPTTDVGVVLKAEQNIFYTGDLNKIKFISQSGSAEVNIALYKTAEVQR